MALPILHGRFLAKAGAMISAYEATANYAFAGAGSSIALNTDPQFVRQGDASIQVICNRGSANPTNVRSTHALSILNPLGRFGWWVYVTDYTKLTSITLAVYSTYNTDFYFQSYSFADLEKQFNGWHWVSLARDQFGGTTGSPNWDTKPFTTVELRFNQNSATQTTVYIDACFAAFKARPKLIIYADDGYKSWFDLAVPELEARGFRATHGIIGALVGTSIFMTVSDLEALHEAGHDLAVHGETALDLIGDIPADIAANQDYLLAHGWTRGAFHYVYPNGVHQLSAGDLTIANALRGRGFLTARGTMTPRAWNSAFGLGARDYKLPIIGGLAVDAPAALLARLDQAVTRGDNCAVMFHQIVAAGASGIQYNTADLVTFLNGVQTHVDADRLDVVTASQWWEGFTALPRAGIGFVSGILLMLAAGLATAGI